MARFSDDAAGWAIAVSAVALAVLLAPAIAGFLATIGLAAAWCMKIDRDEHAVQLIDSGEPALNLYPTHGSVSR